MIGNSNDKIKFWDKSSLSDRQGSRLCKSFSNNSSANIKLPKTQLSKIEQSGGFLGRLLKPLLKTGFPLIKDVLKPLAKSVLVPLGLTTAVSAIDAGIHKKILGLGIATLIISNKEMSDMKIVKSLEESGLLMKAVREIIKNKTNFFFLQISWHVIR